MLLSELYLLHQQDIDALYLILCGLVGKKGLSQTNYEPIFLSMIFYLLRT